MNILKSLLVAAGILASLSVNAQTSNYRNFIYEGNVSFPRTFSWNVTTTPSRGWYFAFGGSGQNAGCASNGVINNGPVLEATGLFDFVGDTGISAGPVGSNYTPVSNTPQCATQGRWGDTHAHFKNTSDSASPAGIGIYTLSGPQTWGSRPLAFFQPYPAGEGNAHIVSNFAGFNCGYQACQQGAADPNNTFPFSGTSTDFNTLRLAVLSNQLLTRLALDAPNSQQARQQIAFTLKNTQSGSEVQYLMFTAFKGVWTPSGLNSANVKQDPVQGGMSYSDGPIGGVGQSTNYHSPADGNNYALWTSWASPTEFSGPWFGQKSFQIEVSFNQFLTLLKLATANALGKAPSQVTEAEIVQRYGASYKVPSTWMLYGAAVAHEVSNPVWQNSTAVAGGGFTTLKVLSLP